MSARYVAGEDPPCEDTRDNAGMSPQHISPAEAQRRQRAGAVLIDVRETHERATGQAEGW